MYSDGRRNAYPFDSNGCLYFAVMCSVLYAGSTNPMFTSFAMEPLISPISLGCPTCPPRFTDRIFASRQSKMLGVTPWQTASITANSCVARCDLSPPPLLFDYFSQLSTHPISPVECCGHTTKGVGCSLTMGPLFLFAPDSRLLPGVALLPRLRACFTLSRVSWLPLSHACTPSLCFLSRSCCE